MVPMSYEVTTPVFEGPFDLLLHLILREQVELYDISLTKIVDAYLAELDAMERFSLDVATEFLLIAATLIELKTRRLLPGDDDLDLDDELAVWSERDLLLTRLVECKTFKDAASALHRLAGNAGLSFLTKLASGYWNIFDPTNGFTAIHARVVERIALDRVATRYFFESDMLFRLGTMRAAVIDVPMVARYGEEVSNLRVRSTFLPFLGKNVKNFCKRLFYNYFLRDFSVASVQLLPARQRAALLLRDVIGYTAAEVAGMLEASVAGVNSALQRARATLERERDAARLTRGHAPAGCPDEHALVQRLIDAWHAADVGAIVKVLTEDALLTMPPEPGRYVGRDAIGAFLAAVPFGGRRDRFRLVPTRANRQPALGAYARDTDAGPYHAHGVVVLAIEGIAIIMLVYLTISLSISLFMNWYNARIALVER